MKSIIELIVRAKLHLRTLLEFYSNKIKELSNEVNGHWEAAICMASEEGPILERTMVTNRIFAAVPSLKVIPHIPLASIQLEPSTRYYI